MKEDKVKIKFKELVKEFLYYKEVKVKSSTFSNYIFCIEHRLYPYLKNRTIEELEKYNFNKFTHKLLERLSYKTTRDTIVLLKEILKFAERKYDLDFKLDLVPLPKVDKKEVIIFNEKERETIENWALKTNDIRGLGIIISLYTGLRIGEICALKWEKIDFENECIEVDKTIERIYVNNKKTKVMIDKPKTKSSQRKIPLAKKIKELLKPYSQKYSQKAFVLTGKENKYYEPISYRIYYKKVLEKLNIEYKNYHTLRHTFSTRCIRLGMDIKSLSEVLGHSNVSTTLNIYVHSNFETKKKFINKL